MLVVMLGPGCSSGAKNTDRPTNPVGGTDGSGDAGDDAAPSVPDDSPLTESECGAMLDHVVDIGHAEQKRTLDPDLVPTDVQVAKIKQTQREQAMPMCLKLPRTAYRCALASSSAAQLAACDESP